MLIAEGVAGPERSNSIIYPGSPNNNQMTIDLHWSIQIINKS
jgi:hypothetical protein